MTPNPREAPAIRLMRERIEIGVPVPTDIARGVLAETELLSAIAQRAQSIVETPSADLHHGRGAVRAAEYILTGVWPDDTPS